MPPRHQAGALLHSRGLWHSLASGSALEGRPDLAGFAGNSFVNVEIPDKTYFKIGEAAKLVEVKPYIIRYWESEFRALRPAKTKSRQRLFQRKDIELLLVIRTLLYERKFTIEGARQQLKEYANAGLSIEQVLDGLVNGTIGVGPGVVASVEEETEPSIEVIDGTRIEELEGDNQSLKAELSELKERYERERASREVAEDELERAQRALEDTESHAGKDATEAHQKIATLETEVAALRAEKQVLTANNADLENARSELLGRLEALEAKLAETPEHDDADARRAETLAMENDELRKDLEHWIRRHQRLRSQMEELWNSALDLAEPEP